MDTTRKTLIVTVALPLLLGGLLCYSFPGFLYRSAIEVVRWWGGLERHEVRVGEHLWRYVEGGSGETILFIHGFGGDKDHWGTFVTAFSRNYRVIAPDLPGFGESGHIPSASYDIPSQAGRLHAFVKRLQLPRVHLMGVSMGGYIAAYYAAEHPDQVKSLALMGALGVHSPISSHVRERYDRDGRILVLYRTVNEFEDMMSVVFHRPPWLPGPVKAYFAERGAGHYTFHVKILRDMSKAGMGLLEGRLARIKARTLIIWGAEDRVVHLSCVERFERGLRDYRTVVLEACGHVPYAEKPRETAMVYRDFLAGLP
jgi:pimeloyl-ACP methyl ester carboxylesterase